MNTSLKFSRSLAVLAAFSLVSALMAQNTASEPSQPPSPGYNEPGPGVTVKEDMVSRSDRKFLEKAAKSGTKEIVVSEAVLPNVSTAAARDFARMMIKDHTTAHKELMALATSKGVTLPAETKQADLVDKWSEKSKSLDEDYFDEMVSDHKEAVELFEKGAKSEDAEIAAFARKLLPSLKHHLELAKKNKEAR
jgi:putative membrane protein